jgi:hypothetical protein
MKDRNTLNTWDAPIEAYLASNKAKSLVNKLSRSTKILDAQYKCNNIHILKPQASAKIINPNTTKSSFLEDNKYLFCNQNNWNMEVSDFQNTLKLWYKYTHYQSVINLLSVLVLSLPQYLFSVFHKALTSRYTSDGS